MDFNQVLLSIIFIISLAILITVCWLLITRIREKRRIARALNMSLFLISFPKKEEIPQGKTEKEIIAPMEQVYASFSNLVSEKKGFWPKPYLVLEIATPSKEEEISFYIACPSHYGDILEKTIHGFFPEANIEKTEDYNIFNPEGEASGCYFKLKRFYALPIRTYQNQEADPLGEITNALSKLEEKGEGAAIQILIRPANPNWKDLPLRIAKFISSGMTYQQAKREAKSFSLGKLFREFFAKKKTEETQNLTQLTPLQEELVKAIENKANKIAFETNIRLVTSAKTKIRADQILIQLINAFYQFTSPNLNSLKPFIVTKRALKKLIYNFSFRIFDDSSKMILCTEELTSIYHFPYLLKTPKIKFLKAKSASPPANLPKEGLILGRNIYRGIETVVRLQKEDRRRHLYIVGQTGTGKSAFLQNLIVQDIRNNEGVGILDPHGDLIENVLGLIPEERKEDVVLVDPSDLQMPVGLNLLEYDLNKPEQKTFIVNEMISIFHKLFGEVPEALGPMFEQYARNSLLLLMDEGVIENFSYGSSTPHHFYDKSGAGFTLMEVPRVLSDADFRHNLLEKCRNSVVRDFWIKEAEKAGGEAALANMSPYITSKFNIFIANDYTRPIIGQSKSTIDFKDIINNGKILLVNLTKGKLGEINSFLLGMIIVTKLMINSFARVEMPEEQRKDFYLYMDEFQNFTTESISTILSEARKYRLCLIIAHQFIGQLDEKIRNSVFGNVGSMVCFRVGVEDAEFLEKQFEPVFDKNDLINLDNFNAYVKIMINNQTSQPFNILTYPPEKGNPEIGKIIREISRKKYGRPREDIEREISERTAY